MGLQCHIAVKLPNNTWNAVKSVTLEAYETFLLPLANSEQEVLFSALVNKVYVWYGLR